MGAPAHHGRGASLPQDRGKDGHHSPNLLGQLRAPGMGPLLSPARCDSVSPGPEETGLHKYCAQRPLGACHWLPTENIQILH